MASSSSFNTALPEPEYIFVCGEFNARQLEIGDCYLCSADNRYLGRLINITEMEDDNDNILETFLEFQFEDGSTHIIMDTEYGSYDYVKLRHN